MGISGVRISIIRKSFNNLQSQNTSQITLILRSQTASPYLSHNPAFQVVMALLWYLYSTCIGNTSGNSVVKSLIWLHCYFPIFLVAKFQLSWRRTVSACPSVTEVQVKHKLQTVQFSIQLQEIKTLTWVSFYRKQML